MLRHEFKLQNDIEYARALMPLIHSLIVNRAYRDGTFQDLKKSFGDLEKLHFDSTHPWLDPSEQGDDNVGHVMASSWRRRWGDPNDPVVKKKLDDVIAKMLGGR